MDWTLSTHLLVYAPLSGDTLRALAESGYPRLEVWLAEPHVPWREDAACEGFARLLGDHGLSAASVHLPFYPSVPELLDEGAKWSLLAADAPARAEALAGTARGLEAAAALGARRAVLHLGWQGDRWTTTEEGLAREAVATLLERARACGVELLLENIISSGTRVARLAAMLDELDPEGHAGLCVDLGHAHVEGDVREELAAALPRLRHLHVHDNDGVGDQHLAPGGGSLPWSDVLAALEEAGFRGDAALEIRDPSRGRAPAEATLREQLEQVRAFRQRWEPTRSQTH